MTTRQSKYLVKRPRVRNVALVATYVCLIVLAAIFWMTKMSGCLESGGLRGELRKKQLKSIEYKSDGFVWDIAWISDESFITKGSVSGAHTIRDNCVSVADYGSALVCPDLKGGYYKYVLGEQALQLVRDDRSDLFALPDAWVGQEGFLPSIVECLSGSELILLCYGSVARLMAVDGGYWEYAIPRSVGIANGNIVTNSIVSCDHNGEQEIVLGYRDGFVRVFNSRLELVETYMVAAANTMAGNTLKCWFWGDDMIVVWLEGTSEIELVNRSSGEVSVWSRFQVEFAEVSGACLWVWSREHEQKVLCYKGGGVEYVGYVACKPGRVTAWGVNSKMELLAYSVSGQKTDSIVVCPLKLVE